MKKLLIGLFIITISSSAFANITDQQNSVIRAIDESLYYHKLECYNATTGGVFPSTQLSIRSLLKSNIKMNINEQSAPNIELVGNLSSLSTVTVTVNTSTDLTRVTEIEVTLIEKKKLPEVNVGTITKPNFKSKTVEEVAANYVCQ